MKKMTISTALLDLISRVKEINDARENSLGIDPAILSKYETLARKELGFEELSESDPPANQIYGISLLPHFLPGIQIMLKQKYSNHFTPATSDRVAESLADVMMHYSGFMFVSDWRKWRESIGNKTETRLR